MISKLIVKPRLNALSDLRDSEDIELLRGGYVISTFVGALGAALRETRLTALLGYLIAVEPNPFLEFFGFTGSARNVRLEQHHGTARSDILVETSHGLGVVEAKIDSSDPFEQSIKYAARWTILLTQYMPAESQRRSRGVRYISWQELSNVLLGLTRSQKPRVSFLSSDLLKYLEVHRMAKHKRSVEIYAREINEPITLALFLKAQMYGCRYEANSRMPEALYFAPHFGQTLERTHPGIRHGISYVAQIDHVEVARTWDDFFGAVRKVKGKAWWNSHKGELTPLQTEWSWDEGEKYSFLFLNTPHLVFNPPVNKEKLQKGKGWLSKRVFTFEEFFQAWGG